MVEPKSFWNFDRILLIILILGVSNFILLGKVVFEYFFAQNNLLNVIAISIAGLGLSAVIITILTYYSARFIKYLQKKNRIYFTIILLFGTSWSIFSALKEGSWLVFFGSLSFVGFTIMLERRFNKNKK